MAAPLAGGSQADPTPELLFPHLVSVLPFLRRARDRSSLSVLLAVSNSKPAASPREGRPSLPLVFLRKGEGISCVLGFSGFPAGNRVSNSHNNGPCPSLRISYLDIELIN